VVDIEGPSSPKVSPKVVSVPAPGAVPKLAGRAGERSGAGGEKSGCAMTDILEESMRSLSLGKK